jgi:tripartite-type tricarboxylate transporter receptor subunit TctC
VIENKGGAGTVLGAMEASKASPDGYTLLLATNGTLAINPTLYKSLPYNPEKEFVPISFVGSVPFLLVANPELHITSVKAMVAAAKAKPNKYNFASGGAGSSGHAFFELLLSMTHTHMTHVPYKGNALALNDVMSGQVQFLFSDLASVEPLVKAGKLDALAVSTATRVPEDPHIPAVSESVPGYSAESWQMLVAPAGTPPSIVNKLNAAVNSIVNSSDVRQQFAKFRTVPNGMGSSQDLHSFLAAEVVRWGNVIKSAGLAATQ